MKRRCGFGPVVLLVAAAMLSGCAATAAPNESEGTNVTSETDSELRDAGFAHLSETRAEMARVQLAIHDGQWSVDTYGAAPVRATCESGASGYSFTMSRSVANLEFDIDVAAGQLVETLLAEGWNSAGIPAQSTTGDEPGIVAVRATGSPGGNVQTLSVTLYEATHSVLIKAESRCFEGDQGRLYALVFPDNSSLIVPVYPEAEHPNDAPVFEFSLAAGTAVNELDR